MSFMEKQDKNMRIVTMVFLLIIGAYYFGGLSKKDSDNFKQKTNIEVTSVQVTKFYNGEWGYSLSIPSGNESTCIWTGTGGNAAIPWSETTHANTANEKHTILRDLTINYDFKVSCTDDFGNQYVGIFPSE